MKNRFLLLGALAAAVLVVTVVVWGSTRPTGAAVSFQIRAVTNDVAGYPTVEMVMTKDRIAVVVPHSIARKIGDAWIWDPIPTNQIAEMKSLIPPADCDDWSSLATIHFPSSSPWRLRLEVIEPQTGLAGFLERLKFRKDYYTRGGVINVLLGSKPARYTGRAYLVESEEIR
jgi:hypothetical protein